MPRSSIALAAALLMTGCGPLADRAGHLAASPEQVHLRAVAEGSALPVPLTLMNLGEGPLALLRLRFAVSTGYSATGLALPLTLAPAEEVVVTLQYRPGAGAPLSNVLELESDSDPEPLRVELNALPAPAVLALVPGAVEFGGVASGTVEERLVTVQNLGLAPAEELHLEWLVARPDFEAELSADRVAAGGIAELRVRYAPRGGDEDEALLRLRWESGEQLVKVSGRQDLRPPE